MLDQTLSFGKVLFYEKNNKIYLNQRNYPRVSFIKKKKLKYKKLAQRHPSSGKWIKYFFKNIQIVIMLNLNYLCEKISQYKKNILLLKLKCSYIILKLKNKFVFSCTLLSLSYLIASL